MAQVIEYQGSTPYRDFVFPIVKISAENKIEHIGTGFFIGARGFAVTAAHVIEQIGDYDAKGLFVNQENKWVAYHIENKEQHPTEDVAIIYIPSRPQQTHLHISSAKELASCEYNVWGYPHEVAEEVRAYATTQEEAELICPDMIYSKGHVRRLISKGLPQSIYRGQNYYELSGVAGDGCSGGPMITHRANGIINGVVVGVYVGAKNQVGYAVRTEAISNWRPNILGKLITEEK